MCSKEKVIISIITVTFNATKNILKTLRSVNAQYGVENFEHILVDGGSTDNTIDLVRKYSPNTKIFSIKDKGIFDAMNQAVEFAEGEYVIFLNSGDTFTCPDAIQSYCAKCEKDFDFIFSYFKILNRVFIKDISITPVSRLKYGMPISHQSICIKKSLSAKYKFNIKFLIGADYDQLLSIKAINKLTIKCIDKVLIEMEPGGLSDINRLQSLNEQIKILYSHKLLHLDNLVYYAMRFFIEAIKCLMLR